MAVIAVGDMLNTFMKRLPSGRIIPEEMVKVPLLNALRPNIDRESFRGSYIEVLIETAWAFSGVGFVENQDIPAGQAPSHAKMLIPIKQWMANAQVTMQTKDRATGGAASWGNMVERAVWNLLTRDVPYTLELCCAGNGRGVLGRAVSASNPSGTITRIVLDNTYTDSMIENVQQLRKGLIVSIYETNLSAAVHANVTDVEITNVSFGNRDNGAATTGYFDIDTGTDESALIDDNDIVVLSQSVDALPMGLLGLVQDGSHYAAPFQVPTFQNLARGSYPSLRSTILQATDFGPASESPADGTPCSWDLSVLSDGMGTVEDGGGGGLVDALFCHGELAATIYRLQKSEGNLSVVVDTSRGLDQPAVGSRYATRFICPDGRDIPIYRCRTLPRNVLVGLTMQDLAWHPLGDMDYLRLYGGIWGPTKGDRKANYEAPYGGYHEISMNRCDNAICWQDLRTDIG